MDTRRTVLIGLILLCALGGTTAFGAPMPCQSGTLTTYMKAGFACTQDNGVFTFDQFSFMGAAGGLSSDNITISPMDAADKIGFMFSGNFSVNQGQSATYVIGYFIDPPPVIHSDQMTLDPMGAVSLDIDLCVTVFPCAPGSSLGKLHADNTNPPNSLTDSKTFPNDLSTLGVQSTLNLDGTAGPANSMGFSNLTVVAPEPSSILLAASGLLGLLAFRARAKHRKIRF
jgi:hypothetical protein